MKKIWDKLFFFNSAVCFLWVGYFSSMRSNSAVCFLWVGYFSSMRSNSAVCFLWGRLFLRQWDNVKKKKGSKKSIGGAGEYFSFN